MLLGPVSSQLTVRVCGREAKGGSPADSAFEASGNINLTEKIGFAIDRSVSGNVSSTYRASHAACRFQELKY